MKFRWHEAEIDTALRVLEVERSILLSGDLERLQDVLAEKEKIIKRLAKSNALPKSSVKLRKLRSLSEQNLRLSEAARDGLKAMQNRFTEIVSSSGGLATYNSRHEAVLFKASSPVRRA